MEHSTDVNIISNWGEVFQPPLIIYIAFILPFFFQKKFGIIIMKHYKNFNKRNVRLHHKSVSSSPVFVSRCGKTIVVRRSMWACLLSANHPLCFSCVQNYCTGDIKEYISA